MTLTVGSTAPSTGILTAAGVGSGLDVNGLVSQLVAAARAPQQHQIDAQKATANTTLSALGQVSSVLSNLLQTLSGLSDGTAFGGRATASSNTSVLTASAQSTANNGSYNLAVSQLATSMKATSGAFAASTTAVGTGTLTVSVGSQQMALTIDSTNNTLAGIRDAINNASNNPGVTATLVTATDGTHLVLSSTNTGVANAFSVSSSGGDGGLAALNYTSGGPSNGLTLNTAAADAQFTVDGMAASSASNQVTGAISGLTLNLVATGSSTVTVTTDTSSATRAVNAFVGAYNAVVGLYSSLTKYDPTNNATGPLLGDATLNSIKSTLAQMVSSPSNGKMLSDMGVTLQLDGTLSVDSTKLTTALGVNGGDVKTLFSGATGLATSLTTTLNQWVGSTGVISTRTTNLNGQLSDLANQTTALDNRMAALTARYQAQFTALDAMLTKLNSTSSYLTQQFDALNNSNKK